MDSFIGEIKMFAGDFAPQGWAICDGSTLSIKDYTILFAIIGTTYGGDGVRNFCLPDLRGRVPIQAGASQGTSNYKIGQKAGNEFTTISTDNMPLHSHHVSCVTKHQPNQASPSGAFLAASSEAGPGIKLYSDADPDALMNERMIQQSGGNMPMSLVQPVLPINFIISVRGIYPSRP